MNNTINETKSIQLERKYSLKNGNKVNKNNWQKVVAISTNQCTNVKGVNSIDEAIKRSGCYYEKCKLKFEKADSHSPAGYIFREINHNGGISGRHKTYREAIWYALRNHIQVFIED
jgi:hypothetical protein